MDLGPDGVPLLVEFLETEKNAGFRRRIGRAMTRVADAKALPYFKKLLAGHMKADRDMVIESLATMYRAERSPDEALSLLLSALKHKNGGVRQGAAKGQPRPRRPRHPDDSSALRRLSLRRVRV